MPTATATAPAAPAAAIDPATLSDLFIADAALRRLSECLALQRHPMPGFNRPALPLTVLDHLVENISERVASCTHALLAAPEVQP